MTHDGRTIEAGVVIEVSDDLGCQLLARRVSFPLVLREDDIQEQIAQQREAAEEAQLEKRPKMAKRLLASER